MSLAFGDAVVLIQKSPDGSIRRVNATVLASVVQPSNINPRHALKDHRGVLPEGEYLELLYPRSFPNGQPPRTRDLDSLFQRAVSVPIWRDGAWIGWEPSVSDSLKSSLRSLIADREDQEKKIAELEAKVAEPSAADLDATEEEKKIAEATSGKVRQIKGK